MEILEEISLGVEQEPSRDVGVVHHEDEAAGEEDAPQHCPKPLVPVGQLVEGVDQVGPASPAHGHLRKEDGEGEEGQEEEVEEHEDASPVFAYDEGEAPHVAQSDGATGGEEDES